MSGFHITHGDESCHLKPNDPRIFNDTCLEEGMSKNATLAGGLIVLIGAAASFPYFVRSRQNETTIGKRDKLSPSQRQRGMYMNSGSDAGPDPDYDPSTGVWKGYEKRAQIRAAAAERNKSK